MAVSTINTPGKVAGLESIASYINTDNFEYRTGGIAKYGHMVFVNIRINEVHAIPAGAVTIFSAGAFPPPIEDNNNNRTPVILSAYEQGSGSALNPFITGTGTMQFGSDFPGMSNGGAIWITGVYLTDA